MRKAPPPGAEAHGSAHVLDPLLLFLKADDRILRGLVELGGIRFRQSAHIAGELDGRDLHAETDAEIRDVVLTRVFRGEDLALGATVAEAAGNEDTIHVTDDRLRAVVLDGLRLHADDVHLRVVVRTGVDEGFVDGLVGVLKLDVFARDGDGHAVLRMNDALHEALPVLQRRGRRVAETDLVHHEAVDLVAAQVQRTFVNRVGHIAEGDDVLALHVAEHRDLLAVVLVEVRFRAADDDVRLDAELAEFRDGLLGRLGLHLTGSLDERQQRDVDEADVLLADFQRELAQRLDEEQALHVTHRATDLGDEHVGLRIVRGDLVHARLDLVRHVRDELHGLSEILAAAFLLDDSVKHLP